METKQEYESLLNLAHDIYSVIAYIKNHANDGNYYMTIESVYSQLNHYVDLVGKMVDENRREMGW